MFCNIKESGCKNSNLAENAKTLVKDVQLHEHEHEHEQHVKTITRKKEITLTIGVFFDGTANNANNISDRQAICGGEPNGMSHAETGATLAECIRLKRGYSDVAAGSYVSDFSNIHWLYTLYKEYNDPNNGEVQHAIYIEGIGTDDGVGDSIYGISTGCGETGILKKTDKAVALLAAHIQNYLLHYNNIGLFRIKELQFDIFGFSRGAAAARHFANMVQDQNSTIVANIKAGLNGIEFTGAPSGKTRFLGLFDTVAAIGTPLNGFNPNNSDTGEVNLKLRPGVAEKVFHITAQHECRFNFALNSVKPAWPELALPGAHSDIGGGYNPNEHEVYFLTQPEFETVPLSIPDTQTQIFQQTCEQLKVMRNYPLIAPLLNAVEVNVSTWHDDRMPANHNGILQKRSGAALIIDRLTRNNWSKVALRVMLDAAQEAGVNFLPILPKDENLSLEPELNSLCEKAIMMGRTIRRGQSAPSFSMQEIQFLAKEYIHCSANWNRVLRDEEGNIIGAVKPAKLLTFINRPEEHWQRTVYDMDGKKTK